MTVTADRMFFSVKDASELLGVDHKTVCEAINTGRIKALRIGATLAGARIPRSELFPSEENTDLRARRHQRMFLEARDKRDIADRKRAEWMEAEREADEAFRVIEHEFVLDELDALREQSRQSLRAV